MGDSAAFDAFLTQHTSGGQDNLAAPADAHPVASSIAPTPSPFASLVPATHPSTGEGCSDEAAMPRPQAAPSTHPARSVSLGTFAAVDTEAGLKVQERQSLMQESQQAEGAMKGGSNDEGSYIGPPEDLRESNGNPSDGRRIVSR